MLLVCRFVPPDDPDELDAFVDRGRRAVALLGRQEGCRAVELGRGVDEPAHWVLVATFDSVTAYRRALSPFEVREHVVPWLSEAVNIGAGEPTTFERRVSAGPDGAVEHQSLLSARPARERRSR